MIPQSLVKERQGRSTCNDQHQLSCFERRRRAKKLCDRLLCVYAVSFGGTCVSPPVSLS